MPKLDDFDIHRVSADSSFVSRAFELDVRRVICFFSTGEFPNYAILNGHEGRAMKQSGSLVAPYVLSVRRKGESSVIGDTKWKWGVRGLNWKATLPWR